MVFNQKGIAPVAILVILAVLVAGISGGTVFVLKNKQLARQAEENQKQVDDLGKQIESLQKENKKLKGSSAGGSLDFLKDISDAEKKAKASTAKQNVASVATSLALYNDDCGDYPTSLNWGGELKGTSKCSPVNIVYASKLPEKSKDGISHDYQRFDSARFKLTVSQDSKIIYTCTENGCE